MVRLGRLASQFWRNSRGDCVSLSINQLRIKIPVIGIGIPIDIAGVMFYT